MRIGIIDYGMGNLFSVEQALKRLHVDVLVSNDVIQLRRCDAFVLPGVGAFSDAYESLERTNMTLFIEEIKQAKRPLLGICLGMQLLFETSDENGLHRGLGLLKGHIKKFDVNELRVPHMGWNTLHFTKPVERLAQDEHVYFVHSYYAEQLEEGTLVAYTEYGDVCVPAIVQKNQITAMQFHPEKSGECGMYVLQSWLNSVREEGQME